MSNIKSFVAFEGPFELSFVHSVVIQIWTLESVLIPSVWLKMFKLLFILFVNELWFIWQINFINAMMIKKNDF